MKQTIRLADAENDIENRILRSGCRHTDGDVNIMLVTYYRARGIDTRRDFTRSIERIQKTVEKNEAGAALWRAAQ